MPQTRTLVGLFLILLFVVGLWVVNDVLQPTAARLQDTDPVAKEALELVQQHLSREGYTLEESLQLFVDGLQKKGVPYREEDWQVAPQKDQKFMVRKIVREKGETGWIEREFAWRVDMKEKSIRVVSLAAQQLMPFENLPPLPHQDEVSFLVRPGEAVRQFG